MLLRRAIHPCSEAEGPQNAAIQLRAVNSEGARRAPSVLHLREVKRDDFPDYHARQLQWLVAAGASRLDEAAVCRNT
jgi:hypothetical protein